jgi:radical SAM/Cys-rich protein
VYNPVGPSLPPSQESLERDYKRRLWEDHGLVFNELWTITNMPIRRWRHELERDGRLEAYLALLVESFNPSTVESLMCRRQVSVGPRGEVYDCDFNLAIDLSSPAALGRPVWELRLDELAGAPIATGEHCLGCTAGCGSSCGGALV